MIPIGYEALWAPELVWTARSKEISRSYRNWKSNILPFPELEIRHSAVRPVASPYVDCAIPSLYDTKLKVRRFLIYKMIIELCGYCDTFRKFL
jgi:hypothetical protein